MPRNFKNNSISLQGLIRNTLYMNTPNFTLTVIPLQGAALHMYILLPKNDIYNIRHFSQSTKDFQMFKTIQEDHQYNFLDVKIRLPNVFKCHKEVDVIRPVLKDMWRQIPNLEGSFHLNRVAQDLKVAHAVQQLQISISNDENGAVGNDSQRTNSWDVQEKMQHEETLLVPMVKLQVTTPFLVFIMQEKHKVVLLWGSISDPSKLALPALRP